jgi:2-dehydropantoate 2-reductase
MTETTSDARGAQRDGKARVLVMGAGAVGGYFGACLVRAGHDVTFIARGANLERLRSDGLRITGAMGEFTISDAKASDVATPADLVLMSVKNYDLDDATKSIASSGGVVLTLQNGVDAPYRVRELLGDIVLGGSTGIVADLPEPGRVHVVSNYAWIRFGEIDGSGSTERVELVTAILGVDGVEPMPVPDARISLWEKMSLMCGMAGLTTLHQRPMGEILGDEELRATFESLVRECAAIATARGVPLSDDFVERRMRYAGQIDPTAMSSMSRDFARGKPIELETFNGAIVRMGAEDGIDVPCNRAVYDRIRSAR